MSDRESELRHATIRSCGIVKEIAIDPSRFYLISSGANLSSGVSTSAPVGLTNFVTNGLMRAISFHASATELNLVGATIPIPMDFRNMEAVKGRKPSMELWMRARKSIMTGTPSNDDLSLVLTGQYQSPTLDPRTGSESAGGAIVSSITATSLMPTESALATLAGSRIVKFDLLAGLTDAERKGVAPGGTLAFSIGPNETIGANLRLDLWDFRLLYVGHINPPPWVDEDVQA